MPAAPPPPGLLTSATGTGTSFSSVMILWITRASRSAPPPTANGMTNSTSLLGFQPWAPAANGSSEKNNRQTKRRIGSSSGSRRCSRGHYTRAHGDAGRGRLERRSARQRVHRRGVRQAGERVSRPCRRARGRPLPPVRLEKLPVGAPHARGARAERAGEGDRGLLRRPVHGRERLAISGWLSA